MSLKFALLIILSLFFFNHFHSYIAVHNYVHFLDMFFITHCINTYKILIKTKLSGVQALANKPHTWAASAVSSIPKLFFFITQQSLVIKKFKPNMLATLLLVCMLGYHNVNV